MTRLLESAARPGTASRRRKPDIDRVDRDMTLRRPVPGHAAAASLALGAEAAEEPVATCLLLRATGPVEPPVADRARSAEPAGGEISRAGGAVAAPRLW